MITTINNLNQVNKPIEHPQIKNKPLNNKLNQVNKPLISEDPNLKKEFERYARSIGLIKGTERYDRIRENFMKKNKPKNPSEPVVFKIKRFSRDQISLEAGLLRKGYSKREVISIIPDLENLDEELYKKLWNWIEKGERQELIRNNRSLSQIMSKEKVNYPTALIIMNQNDNRDL